MAVARRGARTKVDEIMAAILGVVGSRHRRQSIRPLGFGPRAGGGEGGRPGIFRSARRSGACWSATRLVLGAACAEVNSTRRPAKPGRSHVASPETPPTHRGPTRSAYCDPLQ